MVELEHAAVWHAAGRAYGMRGAAGADAKAIL